MKEGTHMSQLDYMIELLELKNNNIKFYENCYHKYEKSQQFLASFIKLPCSVILYTS